MIAPEQVADLRKGDVVELRDERWPDGTVVRGPLRPSPDGRPDLLVGDWAVTVHGRPAGWDDEVSLTVVSRDPRRLYVNHPRTEPVPGDVVRDADGYGIDVWMFADPDDPGYEWRVGDPSSGRVEASWSGRDGLPARLRLLVDGETGQVVPS